MDIYKLRETERVDLTYLLFNGQVARKSMASAVVAALAGVSASRSGVSDGGQSRVAGSVIRESVVMKISYKPITVCAR